jgi:hypothetical protein
MLIKNIVLVQGAFADGTSWWNDGFAIRGVSAI